MEVCTHLDRLVDDTMPNPNQILRNNHVWSDDPPFIPRPMPSLSYVPSNDGYPSVTSRKSLSYFQLFAAYNEIVNEWCKERWLTFVDQCTETFLTLDARSNQSLTIQQAIDRYHLTSGKTLLRSLPECLLIRTESESETIFIPNASLSLENLCPTHLFLKYQLMAIICHSEKTNSQLMFYRTAQMNAWFVYYDQSISSPAHSSRLSDDEQYQLESFIQQTHPIDPLRFSFPLSTLCNHPIIYVYLPEKLKGTN